MNYKEILGLEDIDAEEMVLISGGAVLGKDGQPIAETGGNSDQGLSHLPDNAAVEVLAGGSV